MKKIFTFLAASAMLFAANAQEKVYVHTKGVAYEFDAADIDVINFEKGSDIEGALQERWIAKMEFVDLGLSVKWATCNLGAETPADYGDYYAWGETKAKEKYTTGNNAWYNVPKATLNADGVIDDNDNLTAQYDAATAVCEDWRMPTSAEIDELCKLKSELSTMKDASGNEVTGLLFHGEGEKSDNTLFIPFAGYRLGLDLDNAGLHGRCWSATACEVDVYAYILHVDSENVLKDDINGARNRGYSVRPVLNKK